MPSAPLFRIQLAAEASGVTAGLIRAWERRYRVTTPARTRSGYRGYTPADIALLKRLKHLTEGGMAISQAVALLPQLRREARNAVAGAVPPRGGRRARREGWRAQILDAGQRLDQAAAERTLAEAAAWLAPRAFFDELVVPLLHEVGDRWHAGTLSIASEHLISQAVRARLLALIAAAPGRGARHVVCACLGDEQHELGLLGAALKYRHAGHRVTFLGGRTPVAEVAQAVATLKPDFVAVSMVVTAGADRQLRALAAALPEGTRVVVGGQAAQRLRPLLAQLGFQPAEAKRRVAPSMPSGLRTKGLRSSRT